MVDGYFDDPVSQSISEDLGRQFRAMPEELQQMRPNDEIVRSQRLSRSIDDRMRSELSQESRVVLEALRHGLSMVILACKSRVRAFEVLQDGPQRH